jgi:hypothetical protein
MPVSVRFSKGRLLAVAAVASAAAILAGTGADAAPKQGKDIQVLVPDAFSGDTVNYAFKVKNLTGTQQLGSANVMIPSQIGLGSLHTASVDVAGGSATVSATDPRTFELRNLAVPPNGTVTVTLNGLEMPCTGSISAWQITAKQSNDYSGLPGNALSIAASSDLVTGRLGQCALDFKVQPTGAETNAAIRATAFHDLDGGPVEVRALDANGGEPVPGFTGPVTIGRSSTDPGTVSDGPGDPVLEGGVLKYSKLSINEAGSYKLTADKTGYIGTSSQAFPIVDDAGDCNAGASCDEIKLPASNRAEVSLKGNNTDTVDGFLVLSGSTGTPPACNGYTSPMGENEWYEFAATVAVDKVVTINYTKAAMKTVMGGANGLDVCVSSPALFVTKSGANAAAFDYDQFIAGNDGFVGLAPDCVDYNPLDPPDNLCIIARNPMAGGAAQILLSAPDTLADPRLR